MPADGAARRVGIGGPVLLWLLPVGGWTGEVALHWWEGTGSAVAAVIGGEADMWLDAIGPAGGVGLGSGAIAHWIGCPSSQITGVAIGTLVGHGI